MVCFGMHERSRFRVIDIQEDSLMAAVDSWIDGDEDDRIIRRDNCAYVLDARPRNPAVKQLILELGIRPTARGLSRARDSNFLVADERGRQRKLPADRPSEVKRVTGAISRVGRLRSSV